MGPFVPQQPSAYYVPRELLEGIEASLDNPSESRSTILIIQLTSGFLDTGDVRFVCLERLSSEKQISPSLSPSITETPITRCSSTTSSLSSFNMQTTARKRIIYAHSDILIKRSEYFATMLASAFSENSSGLVIGERKLYTVVVEEVDFETVYWLLKWVYANWLRFSGHDDPRAAVDGVGAGWSARWLNSQGSEWDWKTFRKGSASEGSSVGDARSANSGESLQSTADSKSKSFETGNALTSPSTRPPSSSRTPTSPSKAGTSTASSQRQLSSTSRRTVPATPSISIGNTTTSSISQTKPVPTSLIRPTTSYSPSHYPISPRSQRQRTHAASTVSTPDPHPHPTPAPGPASALSMYQVAHRYAMPGLAALALEHMMSTITPSSSFALLLATSVWDELHSIVEVCVTTSWI